jgi:hypothetical protein
MSSPYHRWFEGSDANDPFRVHTLREHISSVVAVDRMAIQSSERGAHPPVERNHQVQLDGIAFALCGDGRITKAVEVICPTSTSDEQSL